MISVIIPAYNEEKRIGKCIKRIKKAEIIVVDDGSSDETYKAAKSRRVKAYRYADNMGKGYALRYGFSKSKGDTIVFLDADLDIEPEFNKLIDMLEDADIVVGSKYHPDSKVNYPLVRRIFSRIYNVIVSVLFGVGLSDTQVGLKVYKREVLENIIDTLVIDGYAFDIEMLFAARRKGYRMREGPVVIKYSNKSHVNLRAVVGIFFDTLRVFYRRLMRKYPRS